MSKVVPLAYHAVFGWLCLSILVAIHSANAQQPIGPLAVKATVVNACSVAVVRSIPAKSVDLMSSAVMNTSNLIRARCRKDAVWRVEVDKGTSEDVMKRVGYTLPGSRVRVTINF